jgi:hypothetical protein
MYSKVRSYVAVAAENYLEVKWCESAGLSSPDNVPSHDRTEPEFVS